jgi:hypothetical protein
MQVDYDAFEAGGGGGGDNKALQKRSFIWDVGLVISGLAVAARLLRWPRTTA